MKRKTIEILSKIIFFMIILYLLRWRINASFPFKMNLMVIAGGVLLTYPVVLTGRKILDGCQSFYRVS